MQHLFDLRPDYPGYRLQKLEVFNWGTFDSSDGNVFCFEPQGRTSLLVGHNGSGKSTLLHLFAGLEGVDQGEISWGPDSINHWSPRKRAAERAVRLGLVFQAYHLVGEMTALENVLLAARIAGTVSAETRERARHLLDRVGLGNRLDHRPGMLSGGEQQRVAIARALAMEPTLLLADEPTGDLDEATAKVLHDLLREMHRERRLTSIIATHNMRLAAGCDRVLHLEAGQLRLT